MHGMPPNPARTESVAPRRAVCSGHGVATDAKRFVYILQSLSQPDRQFVESATHVSTRVATHNAGYSPLTASSRPWRLVAVVQFSTEGAALRFEKFLKTGQGRALVKQYFAREERT